jgi:hypothetical protein
MEALNNSDGTNDGSRSVSTATSGQNRQSNTSRCHAESALAIVEDYLTVLPDDCNANTPVCALLIRKLDAALRALKYN